jgi:MFS family permease
MWLRAPMFTFFFSSMECSEFVKYRFGYDDSRAAAIASVAQILPIFFMPLLGVFVDRYGKRSVLSKSS